MRLRTVTTVNSSKSGLFLTGTMKGNGVKRGIYNILSVDNNSGGAYGYFSRINISGGSTGDKYGIYSEIKSGGSGKKYGVYTKIEDGVDNYALYAKSDVLTSYAGYFDGQTEVEGNFILKGINGRFIFSSGWQNGEDFLTITPNSGSSESSNWNFDNQLVLWNDGTMVKEISDSNLNAIVVDNNGTENFIVKGNGDVYAREVEVTLDPFPDYVFEKDYDLMPLNQLEKYVEENKHLPNVPSAKTIEEEGVGLGKLANLSFEKIEELTLYILELNKRIENLEKENSDLKKRIK